MMDDLQVKTRLIELIDAMPAKRRRELLELLEAGRRENRRHSRKNCRRPAMLSVRNGRYEGTVRNAGDGGVFIETSAPMTVGQEVSLIFSLFSFEDPITITGRVVRTEPLGVAVQFKRTLQDLLTKKAKGSGRQNPKDVR